MMKFGHVRDLEEVNLPKQICKVVLDAVTILDREYGEFRNIDGDEGGYVLVLEEKSDLGELVDINIDVNKDIPEYIDIINCDDGRLFVSLLILLGNDLGIVLVMPIGFLENTGWELVL